MFSGSSSNPEPLSGSPANQCSGSPNTPVTSLWPASEGLWAGRAWVASGPLRLGAKCRTEPPVSDYGSEFLRGTWRPGVRASALWVQEGLWGIGMGSAEWGSHIPSRTQTESSSPPLPSLPLGVPGLAALALRHWELGCAVHPPPVCLQRLCESQAWCGSKARGSFVTIWFRFPLSADYAYLTGYRVDPWQAV